MVYFVPVRNFIIDHFVHTGMHDNVNVHFHFNSMCVCAPSLHAVSYISIHSSLQENSDPQQVAAELNQPQPLHAGG